MIKYFRLSIINNHRFVKMKHIALLLFLVAAALTLDIPSCGDPLVPKLKFSYWNGTADTSASTTASICHDNNNLIITWDCAD